MRATRKYALWGLVTGVFILCLAEIWIIAPLAGQYDGYCGGWIPFLSGQYECSFLRYIITNVLFVSLMMLVYDWGLILLALLLPTAIGYAIGRTKARRRGDPSVAPAAANPELDS